MPFVLFVGLCLVVLIVPLRGVNFIMFSTVSCDFHH